MKELLNEKIMHIKFGVGLIVDVVDDKKIIVDFDELSENKKFEYPDTFEHFIKFENTLLQENALKKLQDKKERIIKEKEESRLEFNKQYEIQKNEERELIKKTKKIEKENKKIEKEKENKK